MPSPGILRRLAVIIYDALLLAGVLFVSALPFVAIPAEWGHIMAVRLLKQAYLVGVAFVFYGWFWVNGGQTLGMRAWRLRLLTEDGEPIRWRRALARFLLALLSWVPAGMGFMWVLLHPRNRTWHGMLSGTRIVVLPKAPGRRGEG